MYESKNSEIQKWPKFYRKILNLQSGMSDPNKQYDR